MEKNWGDTPSATLYCTAKKQRLWNNTLSLLLIRHPYSYLSAVLAPSTNQINAARIVADFKNGQ